MIKDIEILTVLSQQMDMTPHDVTETLSALYLLIGNTIARGGSVTIAGLGNFEAKEKAERVLVNPVNGIKYVVPPKLIPVFKQAPLWRSYLKNLDQNERTTSDT